MDESVAEIESRRLEVLEKQAALYGPQTEPHILIEIAELKHKQRTGPEAQRRAFVSNLDYDFLMNVMSSVLIRFNTDKSERWKRQLRQDIWMIVITVVVVAQLLLQLQGR
jgi:hypothetical protein